MDVLWYDLIVTNLRKGEVFDFKGGKTPRIHFNVAQEAQEIDPSLRGLSVRKIKKSLTFYW